MNKRFRIPVGVIEGFFGKPWSWDDRASYAGFLRELGFDFYIYAPKADRRLRKEWRQAHEPGEVEAIEAYDSPASMPAEFGGSRAGCGVIVIWTRRGM